ncbi:MAG: DNA repair protein RecN, partial [FCB group bacterium]|nr:DNA repair protein RecN [FCB group bacterium]
MLKRIEIENIALVEKVELNFDQGLTVLTGETGAGKSVIVTALSLILGERADREYVRSHCESGHIEAIFDISKMPSKYKTKFSNFIDENKIIIEREISRKGISKIKINNKPANLNQLKAITAPLAEIIGQHANQMLMNEENHLDFLDYFAALEDIKQIVAEKYREWEKATEELNKIKKKKEQLINEKELLLFQKKEIESAHITIGEEEQLITEKKILDSVRNLMMSASIIQKIMDSDENSALSLLNQTMKELDKMANVDNSLSSKVTALTDITYRLQDFSREMEQYGASLQDDPVRLEEINLRLDELYKLKKKYGGSEQSILDALDTIKNKLSQLPPDINSHIENLEEKCQTLFEEYAQEARALSDNRKKAANYLEKLVIKELKELAIPDGNFKFEFIYEDDPHGVIIDGKAVKPSANGLERGRILFSANPGEPLKSLIKTASGGEISRLLLALKSAEKKNNKLKRSLLVFDEVDAGIGGQTAFEVAKKLKKLSTDNQLLVITHLHQIAHEANHHFVARKITQENNRTS